MSDNLTIAQRMADDESNRRFAQQLIARFKLSNIDNSIGAPQALWVHTRLRAVSITYLGVNYTIDLLNLVITGDLETAYLVLSLMAPDDMSETYHWLSSTMLGAIRSEIGSFLGYPP